MNWNVLLPPRQLPHRRLPAWILPTTRALLIIGAAGGPERQPEGSALCLASNFLAAAAVMTAGCFGPELWQSENGLGAPHGSGAWRWLHRHG